MASLPQPPNIRNAAVSAFRTPRVCVGVPWGSRQGPACRTTVPRSARMRASCPGDKSMKTRLFRVAPGYVTRRAVASLGCHAAAVIGRRAAVLDVASLPAYGIHHGQVVQPGRVGHSHRVEELGVLPSRDREPPDVVRIQTLRETTSTIDTVKKKLRYLRPAFNDGVSLDCLGKNPMEGRTWEKSPKREKRILGAEEETKLLISCKKPLRPADTAIRPVLPGGLGAVRGGYPAGMGRCGFRGRGHWADHARRP